MPIYRYIAINRQAKEKRGVVDAPSLAAARSLLRKEQLYPRSLSLVNKKKERQLFPGLTRLLQKVPRRDVGLFAKRLGTLLEAGLPLDHSLNNIAQQSENEQLRSAAIAIRADVMEGISLSEALAKHRDIFPLIYYHLVNIGEKTGTYDKALLRLAELEEKNERLRSKITNAAVYPLVMLFMLGGIMIFLLAVVFPQVKKLFVELNAELPTITKLVIGASNIMGSGWLLVILAVLGLCIYSFRRWKSKPPGRIHWENFVLRLPVLKNLQKKVLISRFARNLGTMLLSRVPLLNDPASSSQACKSPYFLC